MKNLFLSAHLLSVLYIAGADPPCIRMHIAPDANWLECGLRTCRQCNVPQNRCWNMHACIIDPTDRMRCIRTIGPVPHYRIAPPEKYPRPTIYR